MKQFYTTATDGDHIKMDSNLRKLQYYMKGMWTVDNMEQWKLSHSEYKFVKITPDQDESPSGMVYVYSIVYFGQD